MRQSGLTQTALAEKSGVSRATINRLVSGRQEAEQPTIKRLGKAMNFAFPDLDVSFPEPEASRIKRYKAGPGSPGDGPSMVREGQGGGGAESRRRGGPATLADGSERATDSPSSADWSAVVDALKQLPEDVQREIAVRAVRQGIEAQELQGSGLLRAMVSMCAALDDLGYAAMAREIRSEVLKSTMAGELKSRPREEA